MSAHDEWAELREGIARIVWPSAFDDRDEHFAQAAAWEARDPALHSEQTRRFMAAGCRERAAAAIHPALVKADSILKLIEAARQSDGGES